MNGFASAALIGLSNAGAKDGAIHAPANVLSSLAIILCVAAVTTVLFHRIRQPVVLGYLLAGLIVGPHMPVSLFGDIGIAHLFADLGVILLMFALGLEFTLGKLARVGPTAGVVAIIECSLMIGLGYAVSGVFGWSPYERLFAGVFVAISSTTIIVKAFAESGIAGRFSEIVFGILIVEDVIAILLLTVLTTVASGAGLSAGALAMTVVRLAAFLAGMLIVGMLLVPRLVRAITRIGRNETTVVACVGICFASALLARVFGYSVALGAFLGGVLVAESGQAKTVEHVIEPVKDVFAAVFFVSVGMLIDPKLVVEHWLPIALLSVVVVVGKVVGVGMGSFIAGNGIRTSIQSGMSLAQIGEFSFIIVGVGVSLGVIRDFMYPTAVAISAITTLGTPWLVRASGPLASYVDRSLPTVLQTYSALYESWVQHLRTTSEHRGAWARVRRMAAFLMLDIGVIAGLLVAASVKFEDLDRLVIARFHVDDHLAQALVVLAAAVLALPFLIGAVRVARALGLALATQALPAAGEGQLDLAAAPRRALLVTMQMGILLLAGLPLVAIAQPFWPRFPWAAFLVLGLLALAIPFWRGATNLQGHVRAGAQVILEALGNQSHATTAAAEPTPHFGQMFPGLGDAGAVVLSASDFGVGRTLKETNLRGQTGASVIALQRQGETLFPTAEETLRTGDTLVLTGTGEAVEAARRLLTAGPSA